MRHAVPQGRAKARPHREGRAKVRPYVRSRPALTKIGQTTSRVVSRPPQSATTRASKVGHRVLADNIPIALGGRLRPEEIPEGGERHRHVDFERRRRVDLGEGEGKRPQPVHDVLPLWPPVRPDDVIVEVLHGLIDRRHADAGQVIAPRDERAVRRQNALDLRIEAIVRQPVERLRHADHVGARRLEAARVGLCMAIGDVGMRHRVAKLLGARVGGFHVREVVGQADGRLPVAGRAVPRQLVAVDQRGDPREQLAGIAGPEPRVVGRDPRELVDEAGVLRILRQPRPPRFRPASRAR